MKAMMDFWDTMRTISEEREITHLTILFFHGCVDAKQMDRESDYISGCDECDVTIPCMGFPFSSNKSLGYIIYEMHELPDGNTALGLVSYPSYSIFT
jgi:hypothetical protein